jgi:hypothetical protein
MKLGCNSQKCEGIKELVEVHEFDLILNLNTVYYSSK